LAETFSEPREHHDDEHPSKVWTIFKWIFIVIFVIAAILIVIGGGFWFLNRQRNNKKRFY
jgi:heme/copper-type cytochrome/quinol oxidase subunit 2